MAYSLNKVCLIGNLGRDPELRQISDGKEIAVLNLATSETWKDKNGEKKEKTEWHRVVVFSEGLVGIIKQYVTKGTKMYLEGSLQTKKWQDTNGVERYTTEIVLQNFNSQLILLDSKNSSPMENKSYTDQYPDINNSKNKSFDNNELDDDLPF